MFSSQISKLKDKLTGSEEVIADYLLSKYRQGKNNSMMSSEQIARNVGCGQATVVRFSQKLGYPSFKSMMLDLINESFFLGENNIHIDEDIRQTANKLQYQYDQSIKEVMKQNTDEILEEAVQLLNNAKCIVCYGMRTSAAIVSVMYYRLMETGCNVLYDDSYQKTTSFIHNMQKNDVLLIVSASGETSEIINIVENAKKNNAKVISITGSIKNTIVNLSDVALKCAEYDVHTNRFNLVNRASELFLIDLLFIRLWRLNEDKMIKSALDYSDEFHNASTHGFDANGTYRL